MIKFYFIFLFGLSVNILSQSFPNKFWILLKDKNNSAFSVSTPSAYLSPASINRRLSQNIPIHITDLPVNQTYVNQIAATGATVIYKSKWFNAVIAEVSSSIQLNSINSLTCVNISTLVSRYNPIDNDLENNAINNFKVEQNIFKRASGNYNYGPSASQINMINLECMHNLGFRGQGITIGVFDSGFLSTNTFSAFDSLRSENRIIATKNFINNSNNVYALDFHGTNVLSVLAANSPGNLIGSAPKAKYCLVVTEDILSEKPVEEYYWIVAAEYLDSIGVQVFATSLGYTTFDNVSHNHAYSQLNGITTTMSQAVLLAARKGILVVNAAGNEGSNAWGYINVPSDADSSITVGSVNSVGVRAATSGKGPTFDGRIKPDLMGLGEGAIVVNSAGSFGPMNGTSFANPLLAGAAACLWQANPNKKMLEIVNCLKVRASQSLTPNNFMGYGIPNVCLSHQLFATNVSVKLININNECNVFPNPFTDVIYIQSNEQINSIKCTTILGTEVPLIITKKTDYYYETALDNQNSKGLYIIQINIKNTILKYKLFKS